MAPGLMFASKAGAYSRVEHLKGALLWQVLTLLASVRLA
jgi:hypothetical protein